MKRLLCSPPIAVLLLAVTASLPLTAQAPTARVGATQSGIYVSSNAYLAGTLEQAIDTRTASHVIDRHSFLNRPYIDVQHGDQRVRYNKSEIFGFRDGNGHDVRFADNREYTIAEPGPLYIYTSERVVREGKGTRTVTDYSFSETSSTPVLPLTLENVKRAYPEDHQFHHLLDMTFSNGVSLAAYDGEAKTFKINALYRQSK